VSFALGRGYRRIVVAREEVVVNVIRVGRYDVDLDEGYRPVYAEARSTADGRRIHDRGLKYLLGESSPRCGGNRGSAQPFNLFDLTRAGVP
jgi:hypothetical protein